MNARIIEFNLAGSMRISYSHQHKHKKEVGEIDSHESCIDQFTLETKSSLQSKNVVFEWTYFMGMNQKNIKRYRRRLIIQVNDA